MTIDERIEALTQSLELLASMHKDSEQRISTFDDKIDKVVTLVESIAESVTVLANVVSIHEQRLSDIEGTLE